MQKLTLLLLVFLGSYACKQKDDCTPAPVPNPPNLINAKIGDTWTYKFTDSLDKVQKTIDTVKVTVIGNTLLQPKNISAQMWLHQYKTKSDTLFVATIQDTVLFFNYRLPCYDQKIINPFVTGSTWSSCDGGDSNALGIETMTVNNVSYDNLYHLNHYSDAVNSRGESNMWIDKRIGIVKKQMNSIDFGFKTVKKWELLTYNIQP